MPKLRIRQENPTLSKLMGPLRLALGHTNRDFDGSSSDQPLVVFCRGLHGQLGYYGKEIINNTTITISNKLGAVDLEQVNSPSLVYTPRIKGVGASDDLTILFASIMAAGIGLNYEPALRDALLIAFTQGHHELIICLDVLEMVGDQEEAFPPLERQIAGSSKFSSSRRYSLSSQILFC